jgi:pimeloyl-ACP methyl ester carboxylesterase
MAMQSAKVLAACILLIGMKAGHGQALTSPPPDPPGSSIMQGVTQSERDGFYFKRRTARRENAPRVIIVPGILGSKIDECQADGSQCHNIWGTIGAITRNDVDLSFKADRVYRTDVVESLLFNDVYGSIVDHIRNQASSVGLDIPSDPLVTVFSYDWRVSNADNAKRLRDRICGVRMNAPNSPIVVVAHSMGGLMTKIWAARYAKEACGDGKIPSVSQIFFVATPHLGSPKAIKAIAEGYNILFDELVGLKRYLGLWERNYLLDAINQAGIAFPSLYELLPIRSSEYCLAAKPSLAKALIPVNGDDQKPVNLFDVETWRRYELLRRIGLPAARKNYYDNALAPMLKDAEQLLCEISDFDPAAVADVIYLYGREKADRTYGWFHLRSGKVESIDDSKIMQGDGTVPVYSAQNMLVSSTRQTIEVQADHTSIISSSVLLGLVDDLYIKAAKRADLQTARSNDQYATLLVAETAGSRAWLPVSSDPQEWSRDDKLAIEINKKALAAGGVKPSEIAALASVALNSSQQARLLAVAAATTDNPKEQLIWLADAASSSYAAGHYQDAILSSAFVTVAAERGLSQNDPAKLTLQKSVDEVKGWAYLRSGDLDQFNRLATSYANKFAMTKDDFKEPATPPTYSVQLFGLPSSGSKLWIYSPENFDASVAYHPPGGNMFRWGGARLQ